MPLAIPLPDAATTWGILGAILVLCIGGFARWWNSAKPARERAEAGWDAILGTSEIKDVGGGISRKAQPGLVHRVGQLEVGQSHLEKAVVTLADQQEEIKSIRADMKSLRGDVDMVVATQAAMLADKWENGTKNALKAVEKRNQDVIDAEEE